MKHSNLFYNDIYLGTLYEDGTFDYMIFSTHSQYMNVEKVIHVLEVIREVGLADDFDYEGYLKQWKEFPFKDSFEFK